MSNFVPIESLGGAAELVCYFFSAMAAMVSFLLMRQT